MFGCHHQNVSCLQYLSLIKYVFVVSTTNKTDVKIPSIYSLVQFLVSSYVEKNVNTPFTIQNVNTPFTIQNVNTPFTIQNVNTPFTIQKRSKYSIKFNIIWAL
jgi:hypothetical protein